MRPMSSNFVLLAGVLALALPFCLTSSRGLAQEPEAAFSLRSLADAIFPPRSPPEAPEPPPKAKKPASTRAAARGAQERAVALATAAEAQKSEPIEVHKPQVAARPIETHPTAPAPKAEPEVAAIPPEVRQFCNNNAESAGQARIVWEAAKLKELEAKLRQRIAEFESKRAEYEEWLRKRDEALKKAAENVVAIYGRMRPDAAASQLAAMDDATAVAVLVKLKPSNASAILNEMDPGRAARLTAAMVGSQPVADGKKT
jgi:flagellar motility protein MotE (MotC chaperone)